jgi:hypothetical protein
MVRVRLEPKTPMFKWAKTVHALDRAATVIAPLYVDTCLLVNVPITRVTAGHSSRAI